MGLHRLARRGGGGVGGDVMRKYQVPVLNVRPPVGWEPQDYTGLTTRAYDRIIRRFLDRMCRNIDGTRVLTPHEEDVLADAERAGIIED